MGGLGVNLKAPSCIVFAQHAHCTPTTVVVLAPGWVAEWTVHPAGTWHHPCVVNWPPVGNLGPLPLLGPQFLVLYNGRVGSGRGCTQSSSKAEQVCVRVRSGLQGSPLDCPFRSPRSASKAWRSPRAAGLHCREHRGLPQRGALWRLSRQDFLGPPTRHGPRP